MNNINNNIINNLSHNFDKLWNDFVFIFPIATNIISTKALLKFKDNYITKYTNLSESNASIVASNCLFDRFIASLSSDILAKQFMFEVNGIVSVVNKALEFSKENDMLQSGLKEIIKNLILTIDSNPKSMNNDYRNRLNEILVFNRLSECENINVSFIEKKLENGKTCDFECEHKDGTTILIEVLSINNLNVSKQDNSQTFGDFISKKVENKFLDKTKGLLTLPNIKIIPILEYTESLENFKIKLNYEFSSQPYTVVRNTINGIDEIFLGELEEISVNIRNQ